MDFRTLEEHEGHVHVHTHATHGHARGSTSPKEDLGLTEVIRRRIVLQVRLINFII